MRLRALTVALWLAGCQQGDIVANQPEAETEPQARTASQAPQSKIAPARARFRFMGTPMDPGIYEKLGLGTPEDPRLYEDRESCEAAVQAFFDEAAALSARSDDTGWISGGCLPIQ